MVGEDLSSSAWAEPPREPWTIDLLRDRANATADALNRATEAFGVERWFWGEGVCLLAGQRLAAARGKPQPAWVTRFLDVHAEAPPALEHINNLAPAAALVEAYALDGDPRKLALLERCLAWAAGAPRDSNGALEHWPDGVWADTVHMAGQMLLRAGLVLERPELVDDAVGQWLRHAEALQDATGLVAHGTHAGVRIPCHWGRANAWFALAGADIVGLGVATDEVRERLELQLSALIRFQPAHGVWDVLVDDVPETRGVLETSAAAGLAAAMLRAGRSLRRRDIVDAGLRALLGVLAYVVDGHLTRVSAGTVLQLIPFGYSVIRDDRPQWWGQGLAMEALAAWFEAGQEASVDDV